MKPIIEMPTLPPESGLHETTCGFIHGGPYRIMMDGLDTYIYEMAPDGKTMKMLCQTQGSELTERLGIGLLRAAELQREAENVRKMRS